MTKAFMDSFEAVPWEEWEKRDKKFDVPYVARYTYKCGKCGSSFTKVVEGPHIVVYYRCPFCLK